MTRHARIFCLLSLALAACQGTHIDPGVPKSGVRPSANSATVDPKLGTVPSGLPASKGSAAPAQVLKKPAKGIRVLAGSISLDAGYALSSAGGALIGESGSTLIGESGSTLIGESGSTLIGESGSTLIGTDGAPLIGESGSTLIGESGSTLIGESGSTLIGESGSTVTGHSGYAAMFLASHGFGLLATAPSAPLGDVRRVRGALVGVLSLSSGRAISLGLDAKGKGVPFVYTNSKGAFEVYLPDTLTENVVVVASLPHSRDGRLAANQIINPAKPKSADVNEASTVLTEYLRRSIASRVEELALRDPSNLFTPDFAKAVPVAIAKPAIDEYYAMFQEPAFKQLSRARRRRVLGHLADVVLATAALDDVVAAPSCSPGTAGCADTLQGFFDQIGAAAKAKLAVDKLYFANSPYLKLANLGRADDAKYAILKPADFVSFVVDEYLATNADTRVRALEEVVIDVGLDPTVIGSLDKAAQPVFAPLAAALFVSVDRAQVAKVVLAASKAELAAQGATEVPAALPTPLAPLSYTVATFAGGNPGRADGQGSKAQFQAPTHLAIDSDGTLYVSDTGNGRICKISPDGLVSTLAGTPADPLAVVGGFQDGPAQQALFRQPGGLALDHQGNLYVADTGNNRIRKISGIKSGSPTVTTVAGDGSPPGAPALGSSPALLAKLNAPVDVAVGTDGVTLYISDGGNAVIRKLGSDGQLSTLAGTGQIGITNGVPEKAQFGLPSGIVVDPKGLVYVADSYNNSIRTVTPAGLTIQFESGGGTHFADGSRIDAPLYHPQQLAFAPNGDLYFAETASNRLRVLTAQGLVMTLAGGGVVPSTTGDFADGDTPNARFNQPQGVAVAPDGTLYVADTGNHRIRRVTRK